MIRLLKASLKWALIVAALFTLTLAGFGLGWKSWSPAKADLQASARRTVSLPQPKPDDKSSSKQTAEAALPLEIVIEDAAGAARFGGEMSLGSAKAMQLIEQLAPSELADAFAAAVEGERTSSREKVAQLILDHWATIDPAAALDACAAAYTDRWQFLDKSYNPLRLFAKADAAGAFAAWKEHIELLSEDYDNSAAFRLSVVFGEWAKQDLKTAFAEYENLTGQNAEHAIQGMIGDEDQQSAVLQLLEEQGDVKGLGEAQERIVGTLARTGRPEEAIAMMESFELDPETLGKAEENLAFGWFTDDQQAAIDWLVQRSDPSNRSERLATFARRWADREPNAAGQWLGDMVEQYGADTDKAVRYFATSIARQDPESALEWLATIQDPAERSKAVERVGQEFSEGSLEDAETIISNSPLEQTEQAKVLAKATKKRW